jgi:protein-arginine kinase activator protein McsA
MKRKTKQLVKCPDCGEYFKQVNAAHKKHCPALLKKREEQYSQTMAVQNAKLEGARANADSQVFRSKEAIIALTEAVAKLNQAFAQVVGEWRF